VAASCAMGKPWTLSTRLAPEAVTMSERCGNTCFAQSITKATQGVQYSDLLIDRVWPMQVEFVTAFKCKCSLTQHILDSGARVEALKCVKDGPKHPTDRGEVAR
jgi:hypothetical protein